MQKLASCQSRRIRLSLEQRRLDQRRNEGARQPEDTKNSECPTRGWMNIGSVEGTGVLKVRPENLRMVKIVIEIC